MSRRQRRRSGRGQPKGGRVTPKGTRPGRSGEPSEDRDGGIGLMEDVAHRLASGDPLDLLGEASILVAALDPRSQDSLRQGGGAPEVLPMAEMIDALADIEQVETTALLALFGHLVPDEWARARARRLAALRRDPLPVWLSGIARTEVVRVFQVVHVLGDADDVIVGLRMADGSELSVVLLVDHNLGSVAKDGFAVPVGGDDLLAVMRESSDDPDNTSWPDLDPADARVRITEAIEYGALFSPPFESETWPGFRPLLEWAARLLPTGGSGYQRPEWDEAARAALTARFFASPHGAPLDDAERRGLFESLLWYGTDFGTGDPLRWSTVAVEMLLLDWLPRKVVAPPSVLAPAPDLLRAFVRFGHEEAGIDPRLTAEALEAIDEMEPEYQQLIRTPRPQGVEALMVAAGALDPDGPWELPEERAPLASWAETALGHLERAVGGLEVLATLAVDALPDEAFGWEGIPEDIRHDVAEVVALCDRYCDEVLDVEYRTACRRFVALVAGGDPRVFRRKARADTAAAAALWVIGKANELFSQQAGGLRITDMAAAFGLASGGLSQRASTLLGAAGLASAGWPTSWGLELGRPDLLTSTRRAAIAARRDRFRAMAAGDDGLSTTF